MNLTDIKRNISNDQFERIPIPLKEKIQSQGMPFTDVHTHIFNYEVVPDEYLGIRIPFKLII